MQRSQRIQWSGRAVLFGGVLGILVSPVLTFAGWMAGPAAGMPPPMTWARHLAPIILPLVRFGTADDAYHLWGRMLLPIYLLFLVGVRGLHLRLHDLHGRMARVGFQLAHGGLIMNVGGNIADYWLGREILGQKLWGSGFLVGSLLGTLVYSLGAVLLGSAMLKTRTVPRWSGAVLILAPLLGISMLFWGLRYTPANFIFGNSVGWVMIGYLLWGDERSNAPPLSES